MIMPKKRPDPNVLKEQIISGYPAKVGRKRIKHVRVIEEHGDNEIQANVRTIPGIITQRGCCYAGCKGVVVGPTRDILQITHGPIGCGYYSWLTRRNQSRKRNPDDRNYMTYSLSTDMHEDQIIFGGEKKLKDAVREAIKIFNPEAVCIFATCPVGLIGDDVQAVAREMTEEFGINVFATNCEGYKGVSQSSGHHIANNQIFSKVVGTDTTPVEGKYKINLLGEYNIGGDAFLIEDLFERCGFTLVSTFSGNSTVGDMAVSPAADLNLVMCHRSINYIAEMMEKKYGIPWVKVNLIGVESTSKALRKVAEFFGDQELKDRVEKVIAEEMAIVDKAREVLRPRLEGKTAMIFVGGSRAHHYQDLFKDVGMKITGAGYEFAHRDDYEGRQVLPNIKVDADSRNIEELTVEADPEKYNPRVDEAKKSELIKKGVDFSHYDGMIPEMDAETFAIDDINHYEQEILLDKFKPDIFCAGIKEKYVIQKHGVPCKQLHSYDYGGPYAVYRGAINFYEEMDRMINTKIWKLVGAPWKDNPQVKAAYVV